MTGLVQILFFKCVFMNPKQTVQILVFCFLAATCTKKSEDPNHPGTDVYLAGAEDSQVNHGVTYWKNKQSYHAVSELGTYAFATGIVVIGQNIYLCYNHNSPGEISRAYYSINNTTTVELGHTGLGVTARAIAVENNNVFVAGTEKSSDGTHNVAKFWKNGAETILSDTSLNALALAIAVMGNVVYETGTEADPITGADQPRCWKNGVSQPLHLHEGFGSAVSIALQGADFYVAGNDGNRPVYWKNGSVIYLADSNVSGNTYAICVSGSDVYVAGNFVEAGGGTGCWKNGILTPYSPAASILITALIVIGDDIYASGNLDRFAGYWKNTIPVIVGDTSNSANLSRAFSMSVVRK